MAKLGGIYVDVRARTDKYKRDLAKAKTMTQKNVVFMQHQISKINFKAVGVSALVFGATVAIGMKKAIDAASNLEETVGKFDVVFKDHAKQAEDMAKVLVNSYAMSTREAKQYLSSVQDLLVPMGMVSDQAIVMANEVVKLAADLGSFNNLPTATVMLDIQSALVGNFETMKKYGVVLNETVIKQAALNKGLWDGKGMVDANTKAQVAFELMLRGSAAAIGDQERTMGSYANQMKQLMANVEDLQAMIGDELLPEVTAIVKEMNDWVRANDGLIKQKTKETIDGIKDSVSSAIDIYNAIPDFVKGPGGYGIVGAILLGSKAGKIVFVITSINEQLSQLNMGMSDLWEKNKKITQILMHPVESFFGGKKSLLGEYHFEKVKARLEELSKLARGQSFLIFDQPEKPPPVDTKKTGSGKFDKDELETKMVLGQHYYNEQRTAIIAMNEFEEKYAIARVGTAEKAHKDIFKDMQNMNRLTGKEESIGLAGFKKYQRKKILASDDFFAGFKVGMDDSQRYFQTWAEQGVQISREMSRDMRYAFSDTLFLALKGDIDDISQVWDGFMDSMLHKLTDTVADMAIQWGINAIGSAGTTMGWWDTGAWEVKKDHVAMIHKGEMIVPADIAAMVRGGGNPRSGGGDQISDLAQVSPSGGHEWTPELAALVQGTKGTYVPYALQGISLFAQNQISSSDLMSGLLSPEALATSVLTGGIPNMVNEYLGMNYSKAGKAGQSFFSSVGGSSGGIIGAMIGGMLGGTVGTAIGDMFNARGKNEDLFDFIEAERQASKGFLSGWFSAQKDISPLARSLALIEKTFGVPGTTGSYADLSSGGNISGFSDAGPTSSPGGMGGFRDGGISTGPESGYSAILHGTEAVVPLKDGNIPVDINGSERPINITIQIGNQQFEAYVGKVADDIRVEANNRELTTERIY